MLEVVSLSKRFKGNRHYSLEDVSFELKEGEIIGLIGNNGAGKTTLMKLIAKAIHPTSGDVLYHGKSILEHDDMLKDFAFMFEGAYFNHLTAEEHLKFYIDLNGKPEHLQKVDDILKRVGLIHVKHKKPSEFSFGMRQRLSVALCLITEPHVMILDEPFVGLDPKGVKFLMELLKGLKSVGVSIIVSSHQLSELKLISDRYLLIDEGKLVKSFNNEANFEQALEGVMI
ncbi:ABC transporter ATP-binding protein [Macrococcus animalis]|uniref:ABC transporter ATP-binding protein n=1 Tax=Macrococcus animalis TaxID=3395467 RepID=UPI0039BDEC00